MKKHSSTDTNDWGYDDLLEKVVGRVLAYGVFIPYVCWLNIKNRLMERYPSSK